MIDRKHIGLTTEPVEVTVEPARVKLFCQSIGETNPVSWRAGQPIPPTYLKTLENEGANSAALLTILGIPLLRVLHGEQAFENIAHVRIGDIVTLTREVKDIYEKKNGALEFLVIDTRYAVEGKIVALAHQTVAVRNPVSVS